MTKTATLTIETAKLLYEQGGASKQFALDNYSEEELTKKQLPKSWEELGEIDGWTINHDCEVMSWDGKAVDDNKFLFHTESQAKACLALSQLIYLRDIYNGGSSDDIIFNGRSEIWSVRLCEGKWECATVYNYNYPFKFRTRELAEEFLTNFSDLLEEVKPLMG